MDIGDILNHVKQSVSGLWEKAKSSPNISSTHIAIDPAHTDSTEAPPMAAEADKKYFQVRVNEMFLTYNRQWFDSYEPMIFFNSEFLYDGKEQSIPYVVGRQGMPKLPNGELPNQMKFADIRVAGLHPYRGGSMTLTVILYRLKRDNVAQRLLRLIENAAGALDFAIVIEPYLRIANVVVSGIEELAGLGEMDPLVGIRKGYDEDAGSAIKPGYYVLSDAAIDPSKLWIKDEQLHFGNSLSQAAPYTASNFVLYSVAVADKRSDISALPINSLYVQTKKQAALPGDENWQMTRAMLLSLYQQMITSPDLTADHADTISDGYIAEVQKINEKARKIAALGTPKAIAPITEAQKKKALSILNLD
jgi:hypothetical protein